MRATNAGTYAHGQLAIGVQAVAFEYMSKSVGSFSYQHKTIVLGTGPSEQLGHLRFQRVGRDPAFSPCGSMLAVRGRLSLQASLKACLPAVKGCAAAANKCGTSIDQPCSAGEQLAHLRIHQVGCDPAFSPCGSMLAVRGRLSLQMTALQPLLKGLQPGPILHTQACRHSKSLHPRSSELRL